MKKILVKYTSTTGEYQFSGHTVLKVTTKTEEETVHNYFKNFYDSPAGAEEEVNRYFFDGGCVAIQIDEWDVISEEDAEVLSKLGL